MKKNLTKWYSMVNKNKLKSHNKNKNHNHNEIHIHMSDKKTKPRRRRKTTRKPRDAPTPYQTFQPAPVPIYTNRPQFLETVTQSQRENPIHSTIRVNDQVPVFSDNIPGPSRTFSDPHVYNSPFLSPKSEYTPKVKVEPMTPFYSKASFDESYKPILDNSPIQSPGLFEENIPTTSPFRSSFAQRVFNNQKNDSESDNQSQASDVTPIPVIPKLRKIRKKVDVSLLSLEEWRRRERTKTQRAQKYMEKKMKNLSIS